MRGELATFDAHKKIGLMQADWLWGISESWLACVAIRHYQRQVCISSGVVVNRFRRAVLFGGAGGTRTPDFLLAKEALSQLSYGPTVSGVRCQVSGGSELVGDGGLEPPTSVLSGPRSNRLS